MLLEFLAPLVPAGVSPMCGNSICQDRRFLARYMPRLEQHFHYRNLDVSTLKELCRRWRPEIARGFTKKSDHSALADVLLSIDELRYYRAALWPEGEGPDSPTVKAISEQITANPTTTSTEPATR